MKFSKKSLGQNFLIDKNIIKKITSLINISNKNVIEIGPGKGALTDEIIKKKPKSLKLIEKDNNLSQDLKKNYSKYSFIKIFNNDVLSFDIGKIIEKNSIIFGNLPYNISSQILIKILKLNKWPSNIDNIIFMFQKELGEKIIGKYLSKDYGRLSIITHFRLNIIKKFFVSPNSFFPKPKVTSMVIHFQPKKNRISKIKNIYNLETITNIFFSNRRKMINKKINKILNKKEINKIPGLKLQVRPSELNPDIYYKITELFERK
jgi:16S rRNA (adenine1518-N6/adenine1519-N6)-dimethyltransferase